MKKRVLNNKLTLVKETLQQLEEGKDLMFVEGGAEILSCRPNSPSTVGGTKRVCC
jgi:hypothetical protein